MILLKLFFTFFKIGLFTFGGGYAMLPLIQAEVIKNGWLSMEDLINFIAVSESTPGPFAINVSTFVGMNVSGLLGAFAATFGVVLPSFLVIIIVAKCYESFRKSKAVKGIMNGLRPTVVGLIGSAIISAGKTVFFPNGFFIADLISPLVLFSFFIFAVAVVLLAKKIHPIAIIGISALIGIIGGYLFHL